MRERFVAASKRHERMREVLAAHLQRADSAVELQHIVHVVMQIAVMLQQIGDRSVQIAATQLRLRHLLREVDVLVAGDGAHEAQEELLRVLQMRENNVGSHQSAGVDERVARLAMLVLQLHERVERRPRRLLSDACPQILAQDAQSDGKREHLCDALYRELHVRSPDAVRPAVEHVQAQSELVRVYIRQCRDIVSLLALFSVYLNLFSYVFQ